MVRAPCFHLLALLAWGGCDDDPASPAGPPEDAGVATRDAGIIRDPWEVAEPEAPAAVVAPMPPAPVRLAPCRPGWVEDEVEDDIVVCRPWHVSPSCDGAEVAVPGEGCVDWHEPCEPDAEFPPLGEGPVVYVDPVRATGMGPGAPGTYENPFSSIDEAFENTSAGVTIALAAGFHEADLSRSFVGRTLLGACAGASLAHGALLLEIAIHEGAALRNIGLDARGANVRVYGESEERPVRLEHVSIAGAASFELQASRVRIADALIVGSGRGLLQWLGETELHRVEIRQSAGVGFEIVSGTATVTDSAIRLTRRNDEQLGHSLRVGSATVTLDGFVSERSDGAAVLGDGGPVVIEHSYLGASDSNDPYRGTVDVLIGSVTLSQVTMEASSGGTLYVMGATRGTDVVLVPGHEAPLADGVAEAAFYGEGPHMLERWAHVGPRLAALGGAAGASPEVSDLWIVGGAGHEYGLALTGGEIHRARITGFARSALSGQGALVLEDMDVTGEDSTGAPPGELGNAGVVLKDATGEIRRLRIRHTSNVGAALLDSRVRVFDLDVAETLDRPALIDFGVLVRGGDVTIEGASVARAGGGIVFGNAVARLDHARTDEVGSRDLARMVGALNVLGQVAGSHVTVSHVLSERTRGVALYVRGPVEASISDLDIAGVDSVAGYFGRGVAVEGGARVTAERLRVRRAHDVGVSVAEDSTALSITDGAVEATSEIDCAGAEDCPTAGVGIGAYLGGTLELTRVAASDNALTGLQLLDGAHLSAERVRIEGHPVAIHVERTEIDLAALDAAIERADNGSDIDHSTSLPLPSFTVPIAVDEHGQ